MTVGLAAAAILGVFAGLSPAADAGAGSPDDVVSVTAFGALCDGAADDTKAVRAALTAAQARGARLLFPRPCRVTDTIAVPSNSRLFGVGAGSGIQAAGELATVVLISGSNVSLADLAITGAGARTARLLEVTGNDVRLSRLDLSGGGTSGSPPLAAVWIQGANDVSLEGCTFTRNGLPGKIGYDVVANYMSAESKRLRLIGNHISGSSSVISVALFDTSDSLFAENVVDQGFHTAGKSNDGYGIVIYNTPTARNPCTGNTVRGNTISNTAGSAIYLQGVSSSLVHGNTVSSAALRQNDVTLPAAGIAINAGFPASRVATDVVIASNVVRNSAQHGISVANVVDCTITGNRIEAARKHGVNMMVATSRVVIARNDVKGALRGISVSHAGATDVTIAGNRVDGAPIGIFALRPSGGLVVSSNAVDNSTEVGVQTVGGDRVAVLANRLATTAGVGVSFGASHGVCGDNSVSSSAGRIGLLLTDQATGNVVSGNVIRGFSELGLKDSGGRNVVQRNVLTGNAQSYSLPKSDTSVANVLSDGPSEGVVTLQGGAATVPTRDIRPGDRVSLERVTSRGIPGRIEMGRVDFGRSFVIQSSSATDAGEVRWQILH